MRPSKTFSSRPGIRHKETGSPFDRTRIVSAVIDPPGAHKLYHGPVSNAFVAHASTVKPDPGLFVTGHSGFGGAATSLLRTRAATAPAGAVRKALHDSGSVAKLESSAAIPPPPKAGARSPRRNPPNTELRRFYERGDLPCIIDHGVHLKLIWKVPITSLDYAHYLPLFFDGLREEELPYKFVAEQGVTDLLANGGTKILPVVPQLVIPLKNALNTRRPGVMIAALDALQKLIVADANLPTGSMIGRALVPYYRQLLPVLAIFSGVNKNLGDAIDFGQRKVSVLGDRIAEVLNLLEYYGGADAFINIKYLVPTYQSIMPRQ